MPYLQPERYFSRISHINIERDLLACGFRCVLLDIDNTILSRATHDVPRDVGLWLAQARDAGVSFCLVSNNWHKNVHELANRLSMPIIAKAMKPLPVALFAACSMQGAKRSETVMIGDRLSADVLAALARRHVGVSAGAAGGAGPAPYEIRAHGGAGHLRRGSARGRASAGASERGRQIRRPKRLRAGK